MVALSFDIEEFDLPLEHGVELPFERQIEVSRIGAERILDILDGHGVRATFFSTVKFPGSHQPPVERGARTRKPRNPTHRIRHIRPQGIASGSRKDCGTSGDRLPHAPHDETSGKRHARCRISLRLIAQPHIYPGPLHEPRHTATPIHEGWSAADTDLCHPMDQIPPLLAFGTFAAAAHLSHSGQTHTEPRWIVHYLLPPMGILQPKQPA